MAYGVAEREREPANRERALFSSLGRVSSSTVAHIGEVIEIRRYRDHDRDAVMALAPRLTTGVAPWRRSEAVLATVRDGVDTSLKDQDVDQRPVFVAEDGASIVGFATAGTRKHWTGEVDAYIGELAVAGRCLTRGIGRALVTAIETWARTAGYSRIMLETGAGNDGGLAFYAALGYTAEEVGPDSGPG